MRNLKLLLVMFTLIFSSAMKAETVNNLKNPDSVTIEIERMLSELKTCEQNEVEVTVFFSVSEDQKIQSLSVASSNPEVSEYIQKKLENKVLPAQDWLKGKIYELTVVRRLS